MRFNTKKLLKKLNIKQVKCQFTRKQFIDMFGFIPQGYATSNTREIYLQRGAKKDTLFHEIGHILLEQKNYRVMWDSISIVSEIEANLVGIEICKKIKEDYTGLQGYQKYARRLYLQKNVKIKPRLRKVKQVVSKILAAIEES
jgi:hypothetical protein